MTINPHEYRAHYLANKRTEMARIAADSFSKGYTLKAITKRLYERFHATTGYNREEVAKIAGNAILAFVQCENMETRGLKAKQGRGL